MSMITLPGKAGQAHDDRGQCRFTRAVGAYQSVDVTGLAIEFYPVEDRSSSQDERQVLYLKNTHKR